jgi:subtilisin family serine protease
MRRSRFLVMFAAVIFVLTGWVTASPATQQDATLVLHLANHAADTFPVPGWDPASPQRLVRLAGELYQQDRDRLYPVLRERITVRLAEGVDSWQALLARVKLGNPQAHEQLVALHPVRVNRLGIVDLVVPTEPDVTAWCETVFATGLVRYAEVNTLGSYAATPNDPQYPDQYALDNTGQTGGTPGADIDAEGAWDLTAGDPSVVVAVLDSGTDIDHEDLAANTWHNDGETPNNGQDDDGNGFVDDWEGWDFANGDNDPRPSFYHGTHVTGIVNAVSDNGIGIAGIAGGFGGSGARAMAIAVGDSGPVSDAIDDAIIYAADNGAQIITLSLAVGEDQAITDAMDYAYNVKNVFIDVASGNDFSSVAFPANRPEAMAVAATDHDDQRASYSNFGPEIEISAPGSNVRSTQPGDSYASSSGTSFAAPQVAGVAALILSRNPAMPAEYLRQLIIDTADDIDEPGWDEGTGHGRLNARAAVAAAASSDGRIALDSTAYICGSSVQVSVFDADLVGAGSIAVPITSDTEAGGEPLSLIEVGTGSGVFRNSIPTATGVPSADGILQVASGDTIVVEYVDADDGEGGTNVVKTDTAEADCFGPVITEVATQDVVTDSAAITWSTDELATSVVRFGEAVPPAGQVTVGGLRELHSVTLAPLNDCTAYRFEVESTDGVGLTTVDNSGGAYYEFVTQGDFPGVGTAPCTRGRIELDRQQGYACDDTAQVTVTDLDLDTDPQVVETVRVLLSSTSDPEGEWITLTELSTRNTRFAGSISFDGSLTVAAGDLITATYHDADDGSGQARIATATATADCVGPVITDVRVTGIFDNRATVEWTTDEPATSRVEFGGTSALGDVAEELTLRTSHAVAISPFDGCERVHFRVSGVDGNGDGSTGATLAFNLSDIGGLAYRDGFETDTGWTLEGSWERGAPQGLGSHFGDPSSAWAGDNVIGNDLSGQGEIPGNYPFPTTENATSPEFSTLGHHNLELIYRRRLGVNNIDQARVFVHHDGTSNLAIAMTGPLYDQAWVEHRTDISSWADDRSTVQLRFLLSTVTPQTSFGWNIDEVVVKDSTAPDYAACGGCAGGPGFAGVGTVHDPDPCGPGGLVISWEPAVAWGTGTDGTYDVHRGTSAGFTPSESNHVASGLTVSSWTDTAAPVDTPVWYVVRARNDESCTGGEGLDDGNLVRLQGTETVSQIPPAPVGSSLSGRRVGDAHVRLEWAPVAGADHYLVHRGSQFDFSDAAEIATTTSTLYEDVNAATGPETYVYKVFSVNACGLDQ